MIDDCVSTYSTFTWVRMLAPYVTFLIIAWIFFWAVVTVTRR